MMKLLDLLPNHAAVNATNHFVADAELAGHVYESRAIATEAANLADVRLSQFGARVALSDGIRLGVESPATSITSGNSLGVESLPVTVAGCSGLRMRVHPVLRSGWQPSLVAGIAQVVGLGAIEQVGGIHTPSDIAVMARLIGERPNKPLVRDDVRPTLFAAESEGSVAIREQGGDPEPARSEIGAKLRDWPVLVNFGPEAGQVGLVGGYNAHVSTSVSTTGVGHAPVRRKRMRGFLASSNFTTFAGGVT